MKVLFDEINNKIGLNALDQLSLYDKYDPSRTACHGVTDEGVTVNRCHGSTVSREISYSNSTQQLQHTVTIRIMEEEIYLNMF